MKTIALLVLLIAASFVNLVVTGFAQDAAYRSYEALGQDKSRYSAVGAVLVPLAAEGTVIQFIAAGLPVLVGVLSRLRRWPLAVSIAWIMAIELLVYGWCSMVDSFAAMPFSGG